MIFQFYFLFLFKFQITVTIVVVVVHCGDLSQQQRPERSHFCFNFWLWEATVVRIMSLYLYIFPIYPWLSSISSSSRHFMATFLFFSWSAELRIMGILGTAVGKRSFGFSAIKGWTASDSHISNLFLKMHNKFPTIQFCIATMGTQTFLC